MTAPREGWDEARLETLRAELAQRLGAHFRIGGELGRGGMAVVYLADDLQRGHPVALKVLHPDLTSTIGAARFEREIHLAATLNHLGIVPVLDAGNAGGRLWYTMPYIDGESLRHRLSREGQLPLPDAISLLRQAAEAIGFAHRQGVVHRDLKPENLLLTREGRLLVADFGVARTLDDDLGLTMTGMAVGTRAYMSPEQHGGGKAPDARTDVYALGCVLYECLAGEPPFTGNTASSIAAKHVHAPIPDVRIVRATAPEALQQVLETALAKSPADRYPSAVELAAALAAVADRPDRPTPRRPSRGLTRKVATGVVALGVVGAVLALLLRPRGEAGAPPPANVPVLAVLPFREREPGIVPAPLLPSLTEDLVAELGPTPAFRVLDASLTRGTPARAFLRDSLGATLVVDGQARAVEDRLVVRVALIDAKTGTYLDTLTVERARRDSARWGEDLAPELAYKLRRALGRQRQLHPTLEGTRSNLALSYVAEARDARDLAEELAGVPGDAEGAGADRALARADSLLRLAQQFDAQWLRPLLDRGWVQRDRVARAGDVEGQRAVVATALPLADSALARDSALAEAWELRGSLLAAQVWTFEDPRTDSVTLTLAEQALRRSVQYDSTRAKAWAQLSDVAYARGDLVEAVRTAQRALRVDAYMEVAEPVLVQLLYTELVLGNYDQAAYWLGRYRLIRPADWQVTQAELTLVRYDVAHPPDTTRAWGLVARLDSLDPGGRVTGIYSRYNPIYRRLAAAYVSLRAGRPDVARTELGRARARVRQAGDSAMTHDFAYDEAHLLWHLGDTTQAEAVLRRLFRARPRAAEFAARDALYRGIPLPAAPPR